MEIVMTLSYAFLITSIKVMFVALYFSKIVSFHVISGKSGNIISKYE